MEKSFVLQQNQSARNVVNWDISLNIAIQTNTEKKSKFKFKKHVNNLDCKYNNVELQTDDSDDFFIGELLNDNCSQDDWTTVLNLYGNATRIKMDTGAQCNALTEDVYHALKRASPHAHIELQKCSANLISFTGEVSKPKGN